MMPCVNNSRMFGFEPGSSDSCLINSNAWSMPFSVLTVCSSNAIARFAFCFITSVTVWLRSTSTRSSLDAHAIPTTTTQNNAIARFARGESVNHRRSTGSGSNICSSQIVPPQFGFLGLKDIEAVNSRHILTRGGISRPLSKTMCIACEFHTRGGPMVKEFKPLETARVSEPDRDAYLALWG